jgi:transposase
LRDRCFRRTLVVPESHPSHEAAMSHRVTVRELEDDEEELLLQMVRRGSDSVVTWRRAQMVLLSARGMDVAPIAEVAFTSPDRVRDVLHNFTRDGLESLHPHYAGGRPPKFTDAQRDEITKITKIAKIAKIALDRPVDRGLPFSTWSLSKLVDFLVDQGVVDEISPEACAFCGASRVSPFQCIKSWKGSNDPDYEAKAKCVTEPCDLADGKAEPGEGDPDVVICFDEFGPLNLQLHPGHRWAPAAVGPGDQVAPRRRRRRATYRRPHGVRHLMAAYDLSADKLYGHVKTHKRRTEFLAFIRYLRSLHPMTQRIAIVMDNYGPHLSTRVDTRVGDWAAANNVELAYVPFLQLMAQPDRAAVHCPALCRPGRHRPPQPPRTIQHDPQVHHLAQPPHHRPEAAQGHTPRLPDQEGKGCLTRY